MNDISVNELLALIGEQQVKLRFYDQQLTTALARIAELEETDELSMTIKDAEPARK